MKICTRGDHHNKNTLVGSTETFAITAHSINCTGQIQWEDLKTIKVGHNRFDKKVREALERRNKFG